MSSSPRTNVLSERDPNVPQSPEKNKKGDGKQQDMPKSLEYHRQALEARLKESQSVNTAYTKKTSQQPSAAEDNEENAASFSSETPATLNTSDCSIVRPAYLVRSLSRNQQTYISPSDNIMSPATAKLAAFKNRHVKR